MEKLDEKVISNLIKLAGDARKFAYAPYSVFTVGAALLCEDGCIYTGCNVENAAYSPGNCAERTAIFKAVSEGKRNYRAIAIVAGALNKEPQDYTSPCGMCRQVIREFVSPENFSVIMAKSVEDYKILSLEELLPLSFGPDNLRVVNNL